jgi:hypothetical protein
MNVAQHKTRQRLTKERRLTIAILVLIFVFFISWLPYAATSMYVFLSATPLPPLLGTVPAMFAKSSLLWTPLFYLFTNSNFKSKLFSAPSSTSETRTSNKTVVYINTQFIAHLTPTQNINHIYVLSTHPQFEAIE